MAEGVEELGFGAVFDVRLYEPDDVKALAAIPGKGPVGARSGPAALYRGEPGSHHLRLVSFRSMG